MDYSALAAEGGGKRGGGGGGGPRGKRASAASEWDEAQPSGSQGSELPRARPQRKGGKGRKSALGAEAEAEGGANPEDLMAVRPSLHCQRSGEYSLLA